MQTVILPGVVSRQLVQVLQVLNPKLIGIGVILNSEPKLPQRLHALGNADYLELEAELMRNGIQFYGFTPELPSAHRGAEIAQWLAERPEVSDFVVLDDRTDIEPNKDHWVRTVMSCGLGAVETDEAIKILMKVW